MYPATAAADVMGSDGKLAVPEGSHAVVVVTNAKKDGSISTLSLGLWQLTINGQSYLLGRGTIGQGTISLREDGVQGDGHRTVHLQRGQVLKFTLTNPLRLKP